MRPDDQVRLTHMLDAAEDAINFTRDKTREDLDLDRMLTLALVKSIEIVGEAAVRVSDETKNEFLEIPWRNIIGMRNRLIHTYFDINLDILWQTILQDLPLLKDQLRRTIDKA